MRALLLVGLAAVAAAGCVGGEVTTSGDGGAPGHGGGPPVGDGAAATGDLAPPAPPSCATGLPLPAAPANGPTPTTETLAVLSGSGETQTPPPAFAVLTDAQEPSETGLTQALHIATPNAACPRLMHLFSPAISIPTNSTIRAVEASFNGTKLTLVDPGKSEVTETPHSYGGQIPFFKPIFSLDGIAPGHGTLTVDGFDAAHTKVATATIDGVEVVAPPAPLAACNLAGAAHPRVWLTPARLANARGRDRASDPAAKRFWDRSAGVQYFLDALAQNPDPTQCGFEAAVYDRQSYIEALALCYQLDKGSDDATAMKCAGAAKAMAMDLVGKYESGASDCHGTPYTFGRDTGYDIRFNLMRILIAYDWLHELYTPAERARVVALATKWIDWYHANGYAESHPYENYYAGYMQGLTLTILATDGENPDSSRLMDLMNQKLYWEMPILNQRLCGGDWPEGWNYGPYSVQELALVRQSLLDFGADFHPVFDWIDAEPTWLSYQMSPDFTNLFSFGGYSGSVPDKTSPALLAVLSSTSAHGGLAARLYTSALAAPGNDLFDGTRGFTAYEMIFADTRSPADVSTMPLSYLAPGTGRFVSKSSLTDGAAFQVTAEDMSYWYDHYGYANGDVRLYRGSTCLLCPTAYRSANGSFDGEGETPDFSTYLVNGAGQDFGDRNNQILYTTDGGDWSAIGMRFESSYSKGQYDEGIVDPAIPLDYLIREAVHVRPGTLVVRDLSRRRHAADTLTARWHLGPSAAPATETNGFAIGALHVGVFGATPVFASDPDASGARIGTLLTEALPSSTTEVETVHVFSTSDTAVSWAGGVLKLSSGKCVTFAAGAATVANCN